MIPGIRASSHAILARHCLLLLGSYLLIGAHLGRLA